MTFASLKLSEKMQNALKKIGFFYPTEVQAKIIPRILKGKSVIGISETGSGKTHSFLIPLLEQINVEEEKIQVVIISPTRELANQLYNVCLTLIKHYNPHIQTSLFVGGMQKSDTMNTKYNSSHIVIGTPGRLEDLFLKENSLNIAYAKTIVFDEADMSFEGDFLEIIDKIISKVKLSPQYLVFSATISRQVSAFIRKYLQDIEVIDISKKRGLTKNVLHTKYYCRINRKDEQLIKLMRTLNPYKMLIFASTKEKVEEIYHLLNKHKFSCLMLHGGMDNRKRKRIVKAIYQDECQFIVASDIAARGLDIEMITHVIHYDLPRDLNYYIHRSGRSGRFDQQGISIVLYDDTDNTMINKLASLNIDIKDYKLFKGEFVEVKKRKFIPKNDNSTITVRKKKRVAPNYKKKTRVIKKRRKK